MQSFRSGSLVALLALFAANSACTWIGGDDLIQKTNCVDEDGDGYPRESCPESAPYELAGQPRDCNDFDGVDDNGNVAYGALESPGLPEIPYDGLNNDCSGGTQGPRGDLLDADGDGFPGITFDDYKALLAEMHPHVDIEDVWPPSLRRGADALDCNDEDPGIRPDQPEPVWYDGVDGNCDGLDDYDQDGDGYIPTNLPAGSVPYTGDLPSGDCDDTRADVHPPNGDGTDVEDKWYDGIDHDCAGNNDFDRDGDTYMPDRLESGSAVPPLFTAYITKYGYSFPANFGDCNDNSSNIHPNALDTWYDGVDSNCLNDDDFDADGDGYYPSTYQNVYPGYAGLPWWGDLKPGDCNDTDRGSQPGFNIHPGVMEILGDNADQDCDGDIDTTAFAFSEMIWTEPRRPVVSATTEHYVLTTSTTLLETVTEYNQPGLTLPFARTEGWMPEPERTLRWQGFPSPQPIGDGVDMYVDGKDFYTAISYTLAGAETRTFLIIRWFGWDAAAGNYANPVPVFSSEKVDFRFADIDLQRDAAGEFWALGCSPGEGSTPGGLQYVHARRSGTAFTELFKGFATAPTVAAGSSCWLSFAGGKTYANVFSFDEGTVTYHIDRTKSQQFVEVASHPADVIYDANKEGDYEVWAGGANGFAGVTLIDDSASYELLDANSTKSGTNYTANAADVAEHGGIVYIAAIVEDVAGPSGDRTKKDGIPDVVLAYGDPNGKMVDVIVPYKHPDAAQRPEYVSVYVDAGRLFLAVSSSGIDGDRDAVGWLMMGPAD